jgi:hypothetical protein
MNGLPDDLDVSFLLGRRLEQVCFGVSQVKLHFDKGVWIDSEGEISVDLTSMTAESGALRELLGHSVDSASREGEGDLVLILNGRRIVIHDSNVDYESYTIGRADLQIVV